jgi:uncharacterized protein YmfQ (DUF2313 family)
MAQLPRSATSSSVDALMAELTIHTGDDYAEAFANELPTGPAWPRDPSSTLMTVVGGLMQPWGDVDSAAANLLETELDPRSTILMLPDWERNFGLPDLCNKEAMTTADRHNALVQRMTMKDDPTPATFIQLAADLGYTIDVVEHSPFMCGISQVGDTRAANYVQDWYRWEIGAPSMRFTFTVVVQNWRLTWFRAGSGQAGVDPMVQIGRATDLECIIRRFKPAHTYAFFSYSDFAIGGAMAGTP